MYVRAQTLSELNSKIFTSVNVTNKSGLYELYFETVLKVYS